MVFDHHVVQFFDQFFEIFDVDRVGVQGHPVEVALDPRHAVEGGEELRGVHPALALLSGAPKRPERITLATGSSTLISV